MNLRSPVSSADFSEENNFLKYKAETTNTLIGEDYKEYLSLDSDAFASKNAAFRDKLIHQLESKTESLSSDFIASEKLEVNEFIKNMKDQNEQQLAINSELSAGMVSPEFHDYINYDGGTSSLSDFKGKYVYIDVWATWCVPCIYEMPFMAEIEKEYKGKNIQFLGLSIDRKQDEDKWRKMVANKELEGTQVLADKEIESDFIRSYYIQGIPRFILLDPKGNIVSNDAPRPSDPELIELLNSLNI